MTADSAERPLDNGGSRVFSLAPPAVGGGFSAESTAIHVPDLPPHPGPLSEKPVLNQAGKRSPNRKFIVAAVVTLVLAVVPAVLWPGDAYWMWDEPKLIGQAFHYNQLHQLAPLGLSGNFSIPYGPVPTQCYQLLLLLTHDLVKITFIRALASSALLAGSLLWLAKSLRLTPWFAAAMVLGPYLVWTERTLWDATFAVPIGTLAVAAYASFLRHGSGKSLVTAVAAATLVPLIHMQGLPLFGALAGHALWRHRKALWQNRLGIGLVLAIILLLNVRYIILFPALLLPRFSKPLMHGYPGREAPVNILRSFFGPFLAGHNLTGENPVVPRTGLPGPASLAPLAIQVSTLFYIFAWLGIAGCVVRLVMILRAGRHRPPPAFPVIQAKPSHPLPRAASNGSADGPVSGDVGPDLTRTRDAMICIALATLFMQMLLAAALRVPGDPQYSFGTFPVHVLFAWAGVEMLRRVWLGVLAVLYGVSVAYLTIGGAWSVHCYGWPRGILSPSINNQTAIARQLEHYSDQAIWTDVPTTAKFPRSMQVLHELNPPGPGSKLAHSPHGLLLRYRVDLPPTRQVIELIELPAPAWPPPLEIPEDAPDLPRPPLPPGMASGPLEKVDLSPPKPLY